MFISGEIWALAAALAYGLAGVSIAKGKEQAKGDNGVYLSCIVTAVLAAGLWLWTGSGTPTPTLSNDALFGALAFAAAGIFSTVFGRVGLYRATESLGPVPAGLLRRLTPFFALAFGWVLLGSMPKPLELAGGALILSGVFVYLLQPVAFSRNGVFLGVGSAACYALAYTLRGMGLGHLPDPALGALIGACIGCLWFPFAALLHSNRKHAIQKLWADRSLWHWVTALALGIGQTMQFFALQTADVAVVAVLGSLDVLFTLVFVMLLGVDQPVPLLRLVPALALAILGSSIFFLF